ARKGVALAIGLAAAGWVLGRRAVGRGGGDGHGDGDGDGFRVHTGFARRRQLATMGGKAGGAFALHKARRTFASAERRQVLDTEFEMKTAAQITETLGNMKGAMMKLGQMASYLDSGMPPHVRAALAQLQADAPPMSGELAAGVIESEL